MKRLSTALLLFIVLFSCAEGAWVTGNDLYSRLTYDASTDPRANIDATINWAKALGYIQGIYDLFEAALDSSPAINARQLRDIVVKYLEAHPETRHQIAAGLVMAAYQEAFPTKDSRTK